MNCLHGYHPILIRLFPALIVCLLRLTAVYTIILVGLFMVFLFFRLFVPSTDGIWAMSSAHTEMVLHDPEDREEQDSDNDIDRLLRHDAPFLPF
jgi:hypothetical protein